MEEQPQKLEHVARVYHAFINNGTDIDPVNDSSVRFICLRSSSTCQFIVIVFSVGSRFLFVFIYFLSLPGIFQGSR